MKTAKIAIKQIQRMSNYLKGMQADFDDGSLKRVAPSKNPVEKIEIVEDLQKSKNNEAEDDAIYICLENREDESDYSDDELISNNFGSLNHTGKDQSEKGESRSTK